MIILSTINERIKNLQHHFEYTKKTTIHPFTTLKHSLRPTKKKKIKLFIPCIIDAD